ncbi:DUF3179 domain-containing protein [Defluviimonas sp. WL0024]|uniref:DUF3179 domain-containing protein n=1 Tax=Albidovulum salinarum TaxID=2984153 RepID=A0ABT2X417_9RHOB|nr:DUF3179 domain-containing protein [Defluviimonas sp. WL0024]MCU9848693.1 DUF3179 domain-containing protein [Defluviimonas sp. WL0024]
MSAIRLLAGLAPALVAVFALAAAALAAPDRWRAEWPRTNFSRASVPFAEILSGGPPKDGIPALDGARMIPVGSERRLDDREPVMVLELGEAKPRAWPIRYLTWHEIVNDEVAGVPVAVTFCPLCNAGMIFDRRLGGQTLSFGVSGKLRHSDLIMYDRQTESWWQQALGEAIVGKLTGRKLTQLPGWMESWGAFRARNPDGLVMDEPDWPRSYGRNPYAGYDSLARPFLYNGEMPPHGIEPLSRVVRVGNRAWPLERVARAGEIAEAGVRISWSRGQASALDSGRIAKGREVGNIRVRDAVSGHDVVHDVIFAFVFHAFHPDGRWMLGN